MDNLQGIKLQQKGFEARVVLVKLVQRRILYATLSRLTIDTEARDSDADLSQGLVGKAL